MIRLVGLLVLATLGAAVAAEPMAFWNLTSNTVTSLSLAPAGSDAWGPNQCANDRDGTVDPDERLRLTGAAPGRYDVHISDRSAFASCGEWSCAAGNLMRSRFRIRT
jgi:hypothetical protein